MTDEARKEEGVDIIPLPLPEVVACDGDHFARFITLLDISVLIFFRRSKMLAKIKCWYVRRVAMKEMPTTNARMLIDIIFS